MVDGPQGAAVVKNLSILAVNNEEAAQAFLAQGKSLLLLKVSFYLIVR